MKILTNNVLKTSTISALHQNDNYPASNLISPFLKLKYKSTAITDVITFELEDSTSVNSFFYSYTNATSIRIEIVTSLGITLLDENVDCTYSSGALYFKTIEEARIIKIYIASVVTENIYLGGVALGMALDSPRPLANFEPEMTSDKTKESSSDGQTSSYYIKPLQVYNLQFKSVRRDWYILLRNAIELIGLGCLWIDITEENHGKYLPLYCTSELISDLSRENGLVSFFIKFTEAR